MDLKDLVNLHLSQRDKFCYCQDTICAFIKCERVSILNNQSMFTLMNVSDIYRKIFHIKLQLPWVYFEFHYSSSILIKLAVCSKAQAQNDNLVPNIL